MTLSAKKIAKSVNFYALPEVSEAENMSAIHDSLRHFIKQIQSLLRKYCGWSGCLL